MKIYSLSMQVNLKIWKSEFEKKSLLKKKRGWAGLVNHAVLFL